MFTKTLFAVLLAACGAVTGVASNPDDPNEFHPPPVQPQEKDHYFCCQSVDPKSYSGNDCTEIPESAVIACNKVLYCDKGYTKDDGAVTCK